MQERGILSSFAKGLPACHFTGEPGLLDRPSVAIVGTRTPSAEAVLIAAEVARAFCSREYVVVSGLASGIDAAAHRAALVHGKTIAFAPFPFGARCYPSQNESLLEMIGERGLVVYPFGPGSSLGRWCFARRSQLMACHADIMVLVEDEEEGGGRKAADYALKIGKPVYVPRDFYISKCRRWKRSLGYGSLSGFPFPDLPSDGRIMPDLVRIAGSWRQAKLF